MNKKPELDKTDKKILYELDLNARVPCSKIAKKMRLSLGVVNYRIKRLEKEKFIVNYQIVVNLSKTGILQFKLCLALQHMNSEKLNQIINVLKEKEEVKWIVSCKGNWDMLISFETCNLDGIEELKNETLALFAGYMQKRAISILIEAEVYNRDYIIDDKSLISDKKIIMKKDKPIKLSTLDWEILRRLNKNSRAHIVEIANDLKQSARVINYRIKQLIKNKILAGFKIGLNYDKVGLKFYKILIYLDNPSNNNMKKLIAYFHHHKNIINYGRFLANWDFEVEFEVFSEDEFDEALEKIKNKFSDIIRKVEVITISKEYKFVYF